MAKIKGILRSVWDDGAATFDTNAELDTESGEVVSLETIDGDAIEGLGCLTEETFRSGNKEWDVCMECHQFIIQVDMVDDSTGHGIHEEKRCKGGCDD